ncbi:MAG: hypothetical protein LAT81_15115, partial [Oceanicaulis sp.]|nr:hypothetical protein [Oceanicaulis sp.]
RLCSVSWHWIRVRPRACVIRTSLGIILRSRLRLVIAHLMRDLLSQHFVIAHLMRDLLSQHFVFAHLMRDLLSQHFVIAHLMRDLLYLFGG